MMFRTSFLTLLTLIPLIFFLPLVSSQNCKRKCGDQLIGYPFGSGPGCGDPRIQKYITCDDQQNLIFRNHMGSYIIDQIDYTNQALYIRDPFMSTCSNTQTSRGFSLDWDAPFTFLENNVFALLGCSTTSPLYKSGISGNGTTVVPLCDVQGTQICSLLYSCSGITKLNLPISTCCIYTPVDLGPAFDMDLQNLHCIAYSAVYSFDGQESKPNSWKYGVGLKYKFSVNDEYPSDCSICEKSNGVCGYTGAYNSFVCNCVGGVNTTSDCYFRATWSNGARSAPDKIGISLSSLVCLVWFLFMMCFGIDHYE